MKKHFFKMKDIINFYREGDDFGCFSNFSKHEIKLEDSKKHFKNKKKRNLANK
jgi:predicted NAD-dependent protein-ADP-ribosyltransferase YbiA (DUF1768 family)